MRQVDVSALRILLGRHQNDVLLRYLVDAHVNFLVVGGCALAGWGLRELAAVDDMDLLIQPTLKNAESLLNALTVAGFPSCFSATALTAPNKQIPLKNSSYYAELLTPRSELSFETESTLATVVSLFGFNVPIASRSTLLKMKTLAVTSLQKELEKHERDVLALQST